VTRGIRNTAGPGHGVTLKRSWQGAWGGAAGPGSGPRGKWCSGATVSRAPARSYPASSRMVAAHQTRSRCGRRPGRGRAAVRAKPGPAPQDGRQVAPARPTPTMGARPDQRLTGLRSCSQGVIRGPENVPPATGRPGAPRPACGWRRSRAGTRPLHAAASVAGCPGGRLGPAPDYRARGGPVRRAGQARRSWGTARAGCWRDRRRLHWSVRSGSCGPLSAEEVTARVGRPGDGAPGADPARACPPGSGPRPGSRQGGDPEAGRSHVCWERGVGVEDDFLRDRWNILGRRCA